MVISLDVGGLERVVLDLIRHGRASGRAMAVACLERPGRLAPLAEAAGAEVYCADKGPGRRPEVVGRLREAFRRFRPDVVHTHQVAALYYAGPAARREGIRAVVHTEHSDHAAWRPGRAGRLRARLLWGLTARHARRFIGVSEDIIASASAYRMIPQAKLAIVRNGIETSSFAPTTGGTRFATLGLGIPEGSEIVGTVGRLVEVKRQDLLIRAFGRVSEVRPSARLVLVGDGPEREALGDLARSLGIADRVHFAGYQERPGSLLGEMDVFAMTSRIEGLPLSILEAWSAAVPVVATAVGGVAHLIRDGEDGCLVPPGDDRAVARAIDGLLSDPSRARRIGEAGRARAVAEFDVAVMAEAYDRQYAEAGASLRQDGGARP